MEKVLITGANGLLGFELIQKLPKDFEVFNSDNTKGILSEYIRCSEKSKDGNLWFGTSNGLLKYDVNKECFKTYSYLKNTPL